MARWTAEPSVLGELLIGLLVGHTLAGSGYEPMIVWRKGKAEIDMRNATRSGLGWSMAAKKALGPAAGPGF